MQVIFFQKRDNILYCVHFTVLQYSKIRRHQKLELQYDYTTGILLNTTYTQVRTQTHRHTHTHTHTRTHVHITHTHTHTRAYNSLTHSLTQHTHTTHTHTHLMSI